MTVFDSERVDFDRPPTGSTSLSDDDFSDLMSKDSDSGRETLGMDESSADEDVCESEGESDDGGMDVPTPKLPLFSPQATTPILQPSAQMHLMLSHPTWAL